MPRSPRILFIDDDGGTVRPLANELRDSKTAHTRVLGPGDITERDLQWADLLLVDFELKNWPGRDAATELALKPVDGLALAAVLRRQTDEKDRHPPTAIAMFTAEYSALVSPLMGGSVGHHIAARLSGLEWVFEKEEGERAIRLVALAHAVRLLPERWGADADPWRQLEMLLGWRRKAPSQGVRDDIRECRPPVSALSNWNHGLILLRWLLHRVLPYPTCLYSTTYLAVRLGVTLESLERILADPKSDLSRWLSSARYAGVLRDFSGARWWRSEIERLLWKGTSGKGADAAAVRAFIQKIGGTLLVPVDDDRTHVVCVDNLMRPSSETKPLEECVRVMPDEWPPFAAPAWVARTTAQEDSSIGMLVVSEDRFLVGGMK
jgi:hypothetical protein